MPKLAESYCDTHDFIGLRISMAGAPALQDYIKRVIQAGETARIPHLNIHGAACGWADPEVRAFYQQSQLIYCDGDGIRWGMKVLGRKVPPKYTLARTIWGLAEFCTLNGFRLFFLGAKPGVAEEAVEKMKRRIPGFEIAGVHHGYFRHEGPENEEVLERINRSRAHIVLVCFGMPAQELWVARNWSKLQANIFLCGGGVLDYTAGRLGAVPRWMERLNMEWAFRIWEEPGRLWFRYASEIPYFFWHVFKEKFKKGGGRKL